MEQDNIIHPGPTLLGPPELASASPSTVETKPEEPPETEPESTNDSVEGSESDIAQAPQEQTTGEHISPTEPTSTANEVVVKGTKHSPMDTSSVKAAVTIPKKETKNVRSWKRLFR